MTNNFMKDAPVGTIIFNKGDKQHYEKVTRNGRTYWKMKVGSRLYSLSINRNRDVLGKKGKDQQGRIIDVGDDIADYIDRDDMIQIKDGKYIDSKGKVLDKHKIEKGRTYHIEGFNTDVGENLVSDLAETNRFKKHQRTYSRYYDLEKTIKPWLKKDPNDFAYGNSGETVGELINRLKTEQSKLQKPEPFVSSQNNTKKESTPKVPNLFKSKQLDLTEIKDPENKKIAKDLHNETEQQKKIILGNILK